MSSATILICVVILLIIWNNIKSSYEDKEFKLRVKSSSNEREYKKRIEELEKREKKIERTLEIESQRIKKSYEDKERAMQKKFINEFSRKEKELEFEYTNKILQCNNARKSYEDKENVMLMALNNKMPFSNCSHMLSDFHYMLSEDARNWLLRKTRPMKAYGTTDQVLIRLKKENKALEQQYKEMLYKYEFLLDVFPELAPYINDDESLISISEYDDFDNVKDDTDRVIYYMSREEYQKLTVTQRNQLALDRYVEGRKKHARDAGYDYEMYCAYRLEQNGFSVDRHGISHGLEDLGRDLIARKGDVIYVIQCKRYKHDRFVHENTICQLFGTTYHYMKQLMKTPSLFEGPRVVPVLITSGKVSDTAVKFAEILDIEIRKWPLGNYPRIKCNINGCEKIYHLPFDQQYNNTIISKPGEFYALTVAEAEAAGFRRAMKHFFY